MLVKTMAQLQQRRMLLLPLTKVEAEKEEIDPNLQGLQRPLHIALQKIPQNRNTRWLRSPVLTDQDIIISSSMTQSFTIDAKIYTTVPLLHPWTLLLLRQTRIQRTVCVIPFPWFPAYHRACYDLKHISFCSDWGSRPIPVQSFDLIQTFLAYVHNFTALGLEAMGTAFSYGDDGDLQYLVMPPQVGNAFNRENGTTEFVALQSFCSSDPGKNPDNFIMRCWIHTHPMLHAFMSSQDIVQLYYLRREDDNSFGIVLSPRREGVKALCVHLTDKSTKE